MTRGRDGPDFVAGQGARVMAHQRTDASSPSNARDAPTVEAARCDRRKMGVFVYDN